MRVEMIQHITGTRDGVEWPLAGGTIDLPNHEAADLIGAGLAKESTDEAAPEASDATEDGPDEAPAEDGDSATEAEPVDLSGLDKDQLTALAAERGVDIDARWGEKRIRAALEA